LRAPAVRVVAALTTVANAVDPPLLRVLLPPTAWGGRRRKCPIDREACGLRATYPTQVASRPNECGRRRHGRSSSALTLVKYRIRQQAPDLGIDHKDASDYRRKTDGPAVPVFVGKPEHPWVAITT
jgi:hypothetical protein